MGRASSIPQAHLRVPSAGSQGSPQLGHSVPIPQQGQQPGQGGQGPSTNQALMQQIVAQLQAAGQTPTPESVRAIQLQMMRNVSVVEILGGRVVICPERALTSRLRLRLRLRRKHKPRLKVQRR